MTSSRPPEGEKNRPSKTVDEFLQDLTDSEKEILERYVELGAWDGPGCNQLTEEYGEAFRQLSFKVNGFAREYGCVFDAMRQALSARLKKEGKPEVSSFRALIGDVVDAYAPTEHSSSLPPDPKLQAVLKNLPVLSVNQLQDLDQYCRADHTDKTGIPIAPPIFAQMVDRLRGRGVDLPIPKIRELLPQAIAVIRSKQR